MPRVVANQRERFENDELFRKLSRDVEIRYTGFRDRPASERRLCLQAECREGHASVAVVGIGLNLNLNFTSAGNTWERNDSTVNNRPTNIEYVDFEREPNKVHLKSRFILNGVCVLWRGWIDLRRLDGVGRLEFDSETAELEEALQVRDANGFNEVLQHSIQQQQQQPPLMHQQQQPPSIDVTSTFPAPTNRLHLSSGSDHHHQQQSTSLHRNPVATHPSTRQPLNPDDRQFQRMQRQLSPESQTSNVVDKRINSDFSISSVTSSSTNDARYIKRFNDDATK